ncbi:tRNA (adenine-N1)-methyltransferase [Aeromicrobium sp.]|uniref:tRNA (adenine-N1)-methyltransferase n=1 Tax=Aeromicrobium sp. TaxID=1871063 RepID=UPI001995B910|nr:tRNA (adenine-N1)-methyltransferase [Aeromicrobium sp.]MBC7630083.1 tRNA (adenine-N1)-methyltransferase [Aeromicrobium sp.]
MNSQMRSGPLQPGEWVRLTDPKGRKHNVKLEEGKAFSTKKGQISHDDMLGHPEGIVIESSMGADYQVFRPLLFEYVVSMPRGAAIIYPKDAGQIVTMADIYPGARVVEAGAGSGSLTSYLLRAIGPEGTLGSYEIREDFAEDVIRNVGQVAGPDVPGWTLTVGDVRQVITETEIDRLILDMVDPWTCIPMAAERLVPGGIVCAYVATTTQLSLFVETVRQDGGFTEPHAWETMQRDWHLEGLSVRPDHKMIGHTAFLVTARRMAPGQRSLEKSRRPAPGAYGPDYKGPRPAGLDAD